MKTYHRKFSRFQSVDYPWPEFAHLGEQEVKNREIFYTDNDSLNDETFGYMQRYAEAKYENDRYAGDMRTTLNFWHMGRIFEDRPALNRDLLNAPQLVVFLMFLHQLTTNLCYIFKTKLVQDVFFQNLVYLHCDAVLFSI